MRNNFHYPKEVIPKLEFRINRIKANLQRWVLRRYWGWGLFAYILNSGFWILNSLISESLLKINKKNYVLLFILCFRVFTFSDEIKIGSKRFTESYIIAEILDQIALNTKEADVSYKPGMGNTGIVFTALSEGLIDIYPEYTGTIQSEILKIPSPQKLSIDELRSHLKPLGLNVSNPLGFDNEYALAIRKELAQKLSIKTISDLAKFPDLTFGFSQEFIGRQDGFVGFHEKYQFPFKNVHGIDHSLGYKAIASGQIDVMDVYTTDPLIQKYHLIILKDDLDFFSSYRGVLFYRIASQEKFPKTFQAFNQLQGRITDETMQKMNEAAELRGMPLKSIAENFLHVEKGQDPAYPESFITALFGNNFWSITKQHLFLVFGSLIPAILIGIPLGIWAAKSHYARHFILNGVGIIQTVPSLALLAFLIPLLNQIGTIPALIALILYALLPIVRNTYEALIQIPLPLQESAIVLGLSPLARLTSIELPLAQSTILAGIKTAAVYNVAIATLAAFIGAGGYGDRIVEGLALNDNQKLLAGAIPACLLAVLVQQSFDFFQTKFTPKGLQVIKKWYNN